jgi:hypothetical protein
MNTTLDVAAALNAIVWPIVVLIILLAYRKPLGEFLASVSGRLMKFSAFNISIELAVLPSAPLLDREIQQNSEMMGGGEVYSTKVSYLFDRIDANTSSDYLIVDIKDGRFWFVSRVFIFTIFLEAMRGLKCIVFVQTSDKYYRRLLGVASPNAVRAALGHIFPWLETAFSNILSQKTPSFLAPALPSNTAGEMIQAFVNDKEMHLRCDPSELIKPINTCQVPPDQRPTRPIRPEEWQRLGISDRWEHTTWLDLRIPEVSEAIAKSFFEKDSSIYRDNLETSTEDRIRALLRRGSPYIALTNSQDEFKGLIDRHKLAAEVGERLIS